MRRDTAVTERQPAEGPGLYVVCTPIGNLEDISGRALRILSEVEAVACEDTRLTRRIFERFDLPRPATLFSYHEHNEAAASRRVLDLLNQGRSVALCSDAGTPGISDPGYRAVSEAVKQGHRVVVVPGPSAAVTALIASGLPSSSFVFKGFVPRKQGERRRYFAAEENSPHTLVCYESPHRLAAALADAAAVLGPRQAAVCLELTKLHERVRRGTLEELAASFAEQSVKGEATLVIAGLAREQRQTREREARRAAKQAARERRNP